MADRVRPSVSSLALKRGMMLRKERWRDGDSKGLHNCWWSQPSAHIPLAAFRLDLCMSSVYPSQSEHLCPNTHTHTHTHTQHNTCSHKCTQTDLPVLQNADRCADSVNKIVPKRFHAHVHTPTHTYAHAWQPPGKQIWQTHPVGHLWRRCFLLLKL